MSESENPTYIYHWVRANMAEIKERKTVKEQVGTKTVTKTKGVFKKKEIEVEEPVIETREEWVPTGEFSDTNIDMDDLSRRITDACNGLDEKGYDVLSITPILEGRYSYKTRAGGTGNVATGSTGGWGWGYGYGYSLTDGVVIIGKIKNIHRH